MKLSREQMDRVNQLVSEGRATLGPTALLTAPAVPQVDEGASEREFQQTILELAESLGWFAFHVYNAKRSKAGFPDLLMFRRERLIAAELKVGDNKPTAAQLTFLDRFRDARCEAFVWFPADMEAIARILR